MDEQNIEQGKIMQLRGLSASKWNGCIVDVGKRSDSDVTRYSCEVIFGDYKGKLLAVRSDNLMDIPALTAEELVRAKEEYERFLDQPQPASTNKIAKLLIMAKPVLKATPNDCSFWDLIATDGKSKFQTKRRILLNAFLFDQHLTLAKISSKF